MMLTDGSAPSAIVGIVVGGLITLSGIATLILHTPAAPEESIPGPQSPAIEAPRERALGVDLPLGIVDPTTCRESSQPTIAVIAVDCRTGDGKVLTSIKYPGNDAVPSVAVNYPNPWSANGIALGRFATDTDAGYVDAALDSEHEDNGDRSAGLPGPAGSRAMVPPDRSTARAALTGVPGSAAGSTGLPFPTRRCGAMDPGATPRVLGVLRSSGVEQRQADLSRNVESDFFGRVGHRLLGCESILVVDPHNETSDSGGRR